MKKIYCLMLLSVMFQGCWQEEDSGVEQVRFTFQLKSEDGASGRGRSDQNVRALLLSLEKSNGEVVFTHRSINIISFGDGFITEPLELRPGAYKVIDFMLVDDSESILFATPRKNSILANAVAHPLPYGFHVSKNIVANIDMEVVDARQSQPEDFGYVSFSIRTAHTFQLSVFLMEAGGSKLTSAQGSIIDGNKVIKTFMIDPKVNVVSFSGDATKTYALLITKEGYVNFKKEFIYSELQSELGRKPMNVVLDPAFTMVTSATTFGLLLTGATHLHINWGDGTDEDKAIDDPAEALELSHTYSDNNLHQITITGDIYNITEYSHSYDAGDTDEVNLKPLTRLTHYSSGLNKNPAVVDLSYNNMLEFVSMPELRELRLPNDHHIKFIFLHGTSHQGTEAISEIINNIYSNALRNNIRNGDFDLRSEFWSEDSNLIGPPSDEALQQLRELRDSYGWTVSKQVN